MTSLQEYFLLHFLFEMVNNYKNMIKNLTFFGENFIRNYLNERNLLLQQSAYKWNFLYSFKKYE